MSKIEWTEKTWNPVTGCTRVSAGCDNCYSVTMTHRLAGMGQKKYQGLTVLNEQGKRHFSGVVNCHEDALEIPLRRKKPTTCFVNSMSDLFHKDVPFEFIDKVFAVMALCLRHTFQILTKRPDRMREYVEGLAKDLGRLIADERSIRYSIRFDGLPTIPWPLPNVWLGVSIESPTELERHDDAFESGRIAAVQFVSYEPALGYVDWCERTLSQIDWLIVGGESGPGARPFYLDWARNTVKKCRASGVKVFVKQLGANCYDGDKRVHYGPKGQNFDDWPEDLKVREMPEPVATEAKP